MPKLPTCCPSVEFPSKLVCGLGPTGGLLLATFSLDWNGSGWRGSGGGHTVTIDCSGTTPPVSFRAIWEIEGCAAKTSHQMFGCAGPVVDLGFAYTVGAECTEIPAGNYNVRVTSTVRAAGRPPERCPDCHGLPATSYPECCPTAAGGGGAPGKAGRAGGPGGGARAFGTGPRGLASGQVAEVSSVSMRYSTGEVVQSAVDIASSGFGLPWGHTRIHQSRLSVSETLGHGYNWQVAEWPYLVYADDDVIIAFGCADGPLWFDPSGSAYIGRFGVRHTFSYDAPSDRYLLTDPAGIVTEFDRFTGMFRRRSDPAGNTITVTAMASNGFNFTAVERTYTAEGETVTEQYLYAYGTSNGDSLLESVTLRRRVDEGEWENVLRAAYSYYERGNPFGGEEDLQTATTQSWRNGDWVTTGTTLYRYWKTLGSSSSSSLGSSSSGGAGEPFPVHLLKFIVLPESYAKLTADPNVSDPLTASDSIVAQYADFYYEYDSARRVTRETLDGGSRSFTFSYTESGFSDGYNRWKRKTVEGRPDGTEKIVYTNFAGQVMLSVLRDDTDEWCEFRQYGDTVGQVGKLILHAMPSAISGYDETRAALLDQVSGNYQYLRDYAGLIRLYTYHAASGFVASEKVRNGELGDCFKLREHEYVSCCVAGSSSSSSGSSGSSGTAAQCLWRLARTIDYPETGRPCDSSSSSLSSSSSAAAGGCVNDGTRQITTNFSHTYHSGTCAVKELTTLWPIVPTDQNGSGLATSRKEVFDLYANPTWLMDERRFLTRNTWDIPTGALLQRIDDVDTSQVDNAPPGWETPTGGGLHYITDFEHDAQGRMTQSLGPVHTVSIEGVATSIRRATWIVYRDDLHEVWTGAGYQRVSDGAFFLANPVQIVKSDAQGRVLEQISAVRLSAGGSSSSSGSASSSGSMTDAQTWTPGKLTAFDSFPQWTYVRWRTMQYTACCYLESERVYHTIALVGEGSEGTNYDQTTYGYDSLKQRIRTESPGGTIVRTVLDPRGLVLESWTGTNDTGATPSDPSGGGASGNNMKQTDGFVFDSGLPGGDGLLTSKDAHADASTVRVTLFTNDFRGRQVAIDGEVDFYLERCWDNLDREIQVQQRNTNPGGNLVTRTETKYDDRGRMFRTLRYGVDRATGIVGNALTDNTWYDPAGNAMKSQPAGSQKFVKYQYDGLNRNTKKFVGYDLSESSYADAGSVTGDTILEQTELTYDAASNVIQTTVRHRYHNATGTGELGSPSSTQPKARVMYTASYPDPVAREQAHANYGTNGGTALTRPDTVPDRSDTCLIVSSTFDAAGNRATLTDPAGMVIAFQWDDAGRDVGMIVNPQPNGSSSSSSSSSSGGCAPSADRNVTVEKTYTPDNKLATLTARNSSTGDQTTQFIYGTTLSDSDIASSLLKRAEIYPDSVDNDDRISFKYNRQGQRKELRDQNGTVHAYDFDLLGRELHDRVTTPGTGIDSAVLRISKTYEVRGMLEKLSSHDNATVGSGSIVNEVLFKYNAFGQITHDYQSHSGAVNTATTPCVGYAYADGSANTIRQTKLIYPNGRELNYSYGTAGSTADAMSRCAALIDDDGTTVLVSYQYLGLETFVIADYEEPDVRWTLVGTAGGNDPDTGDIYLGLDRFSRVKDNYWRNYNTNTDVDRIKYGYDRAGNRIWRENTVAAALGKKFDEAYLYDAIQRLAHMDRGLLNAPKTAIQSGTRTFSQCWQLDETGNWKGLNEDPDGAGVDLIQQRTANLVNEITNITESVGPSWATPIYDRVGNMTTIPKSTDPSSTNTASHDAWNRLVSLAEGASIVREYSYDGADRQNMRHTYSGGTLSETRHIYFTEPSMWQLIEERIGTDDFADRQFIWGLRYIDDLALRDLNSERLYATQDPNWNVTAAVFQVAGTAAERYAYSSYGGPQFLTAGFLELPESLQAWDRLFAGYLYDHALALYQVRYRNLSSIVSWLERDNREMPFGGSLYSYVDNSPMRFTDPSGRVLWFCVGCASCAASLVGVCQGICVNSYWDVPGEPYWSCVRKCYMAVARGEITFGEYNPAGAAWSAICYLGCSTCLIQVGFQYLYPPYVPPPPPPSPRIPDIIIRCGKRILDSKVGGSHLPPGLRVHL